MRIILLPLSLTILPSNQQRKVKTSQSVCLASQFALKVLLLHEPTTTSSKSHTHSKREAEICSWFNFNSAPFYDSFDSPWLDGPKKPTMKLTPTSSSSSSTLIVIPLPEIVDNGTINIYEVKLFVISSSWVSEIFIAITSFKILSLDQTANSSNCRIKQLWFSHNYSSSCTTTTTSSNNNKRHTLLNSYKIINVIKTNCH